MVDKYVFGAPVEVDVTGGNPGLVGAAKIASETHASLTLDFSLIGDVNTPPAYGGCACLCHTTPGVIHAFPCCSPDPLASEVASAMLFERERCAKIAEQVAIDTSADDGEPWICHVIAKAIRGEA